MGKMLGKVLLVALVSLFIFSSGVFATPVSLQMAEEVARTHLSANNERERLASLKKRKVFEKRSISMPDIIELRDDQTRETFAYVLGLSPKGFIVVSPDTDITPVIAYSFEGNFPLEEFQGNVLLRMVTWDMENRLEAIPIVSDALKEKNNDLWERYLSAEDSFLGTLVRATTYGPYLNTTWDQGNYLFGGYNDYCPYDPYFSNYKGEYYLSVVGCVATAMAQIINYHQYPSSVTFNNNNDYYCYDYPLNSSYRFCNTNPASASISSITYPASDDTAARLSRACGVSVQMAYSWNLSLASHIDAASAFKSKFSYYSANYYTNDSTNNLLSSSNFYSILQSNMQNAQPALLAIRKPGAGHSIVCDGYNSTTDQYHLNYGWGPQSPDPAPSDWWYTLPTDMPADYSVVSDAVADIIKPTTEEAVYVDPSASCGGNTPCYTTIQSAIDTASSGSVIKVLAGTYAENLDLNSSNNYELKGGQNSTYSSTTGTSSVSSMTFGSNSGTVTVEYMDIQ